MIGDNKESNHKVIFSEKFLREAKKLKKKFKNLDKDLHNLFHCLN